MASFGAGQILIELFWAPLCSDKNGDTASLEDGLRDGKGNAGLPGIQFVTPRGWDKREIDKQLSWVCFRVNIFARKWAKLSKLLFLGCLEQWC